jgi:hypothetical protein
MNFTLLRRTTTPIIPGKDITTTEFSQYTPTFCIHQSRSLPKRHGACESIPVMTLVDHTVIVDTQLEGRRHRGERIKLHVSGRRVDVRDLSLAGEGVQAILAVVLYLC